MKPVDPTDPAVVETIADWSHTKGTVGIRIFLRDQVSTDPADPAINRVLATAAQHSLPVNLACTGHLDQAWQLAAPTHRNREFLRRNRELNRATREFSTLISEA